MFSTWREAMRILPMPAAAAGAILSFLAGLSAVRAESMLPLQAETAAALPHGHAEVALGVEYFRNRRFPEFTPADSIDSQDLFSLPGVDLNVGLGNWVEIQASFEMLYLDEDLAGGDSDSTYGAGDARLFTKLYLLEDREIWPAAGLRFGTKLANADVDDRLGTDETDFLIAVLASKDFGIASAHLNLGLAILGNPGPTAPTAKPFDSDGQDDLFTWNVAGASRSIELIGATSIRLLAEFAGQEGSRFGNDRAAFRGGAQVGFGSWSLYAGVSAGLVTASEDVGAMCGAIYSFEPAAWFAGG
jgi:hypothetical protein